MTRIKALALILIAVFVFAGCNQKMANDKQELANGKTCPPGTKLAGAAQPYRTEHWCERMDEDGNSIKEGPYINLRKNGQKRVEGEYKNGIKEGRRTLWGKNGQKVTDGDYRDGKKEGLWTAWHENGQKQYEFEYKNGKKEGLRTYWGENGQRYPVRHFKNGEPTNQHP